MNTSVLVNFDVSRFSPGEDRDQTEHLQRYPVQVTAGMTVVEGLVQIRERLDATLAWRFSCRMGICGSCGMVINGQPGLACNTQILDVSDSLIRLQPLANFAVAKDLVVDLNPMFEKHRLMQPYVVRSDDELHVAPVGEYMQTPDQLIDYLQFAGCIKCGACMSACPTLATDERFLGPMPLNAAYRYSADTRDQGLPQRKVAMAAFHGLSHCHYAAECSRVCPKGVDPARAIQLLKRDLLVTWLRPDRPRVVAPLLGPASDAKRSDDVPLVPPFTVDRKP